MHETLTFSPWQFDQFYPREIRRNRRTYERIILLGLAVVVLVLLLSGGKSGTGRPSILEKAKMRGARRKNVSRTHSVCLGRRRGR